MHNRLRPKCHHRIVNVPSDARWLSLSTRISFIHLGRRNLSIRAKQATKKVFMMRNTNEIPTPSQTQRLEVAGMMKEDPTMKARTSEREVTKIDNPTWPNVRERRPVTASLSSLQGRRVSTLNRPDVVKSSSCDLGQRRGFFSVTLTISPTSPSATDEFNISCDFSTLMVWMITNISSIPIPRRSAGMMRLTLVQKRPIKAQEHTIRTTDRPTAVRPATETSRPVIKSPDDICKEFLAQYCNTFLLLPTPTT